MPLLNVPVSRVKTLVAIPAPASVKLVNEPLKVPVLEDVVPSTVPPVELTVSAPVTGIVVSETKVSPVATVLPATSDPVME